MMMNGALFAKLGSRHGGKRETIMGNQVQVSRCAKCRSLLVLMVYAKERGPCVFSNGFGE